jgi:exonuclease VII small subunit
MIDQPIVAPPTGSVHGRYVPGLSWDNLPSPKPDEPDEPVVAKLESNLDTVMREFNSAQQEVDDAEMTLSDAEERLADAEETLRKLADEILAADPVSGRMILAEAGLPGKIKYDMLR